METAVHALLRVHLREGSLDQEFEEGFKFARVELLLFSLAADPNQGQESVHVRLGDERLNVCFVELGRNFVIEGKKVVEVFVLAADTFVNLEH